MNLEHYYRRNGDHFEGHWVNDKRVKKKKNWGDFGDVGRTRKLFLQSKESSVCWRMGG